MRDGIGPTALVVENEALIALDISSALTENGFAQVLIATNARHAEEILAAEQPDVALIDLNLGGQSSGIAIASALVQRAIPTLILTGYDGAQNHLPAPLQALERLVKPFSASQLLDRISAILGTGGPDAPA